MTPRILCIDDEPQILRTLELNLSARDFDVDTALTGEDALEVASARPPTVVLLDLGLPGLSGLDVIERLRRWTDVPIIILSARDAEADKIAALDAGADDYLTKPFGMGELLARLRASLRRSQTELSVLHTSAFTIDFAANARSEPATKSS